MPNGAECQTARDAKGRQRAAKRAEPETDWRPEQRDDCAKEVTRG
jgi:hypothetical protein